MQKRDNNRTAGELRPCSLKSGINPHADGSAEVTIGATRILVSAALIDAHQLKKRVHVICRMLPLSTQEGSGGNEKTCLLYTSPSPRDQRGSRMPSSA